MGKSEEKGEKNLRAYGYVWNKQKEDLTLCIESVPEPGRGCASYQCRRKRGFGPTGEYCRQHSPESVAKRRAAAKARWESEVEKSPWNRVRHLQEENTILREALKKISENGNDEDGTHMALEALKRLS